MTSSGDGSAELDAQGSPKVSATRPDAGQVERVPGTATGLLREVARMSDGRRITYYSLPEGTREGSGASHE